MLLTVFSRAASAQVRLKPDATPARSELKPNVARDGTGAIVGGGTVTFSLQLSGFPAGSAVIAAHIHPGAAGVNGAPLVSTGLSPAAPIVMADGTGVLTLTNVNISAADAQAIAANPAGYYFNVHTPVNPGGAARGQLGRQ